MGKDISWKEYHLIRIVEQFCHIYLFWKNTSFFSKKKHLFFQANQNFLRISIAFYAKFSVTWRWKFSKTKSPNIGHFHIGNYISIYQLASECKKTFALSGWIFSLLHMGGKWFKKSGYTSFKKFHKTPLFFLGTTVMSTNFLWNAGIHCYFSKKRQRT